MSHPHHQHNELDFGAGIVNAQLAQALIERGAGNANETPASTPADRQQPASASRARARPRRAGRVRRARGAGNRQRKRARRARQQDTSSESSVELPPLLQARPDDEESDDDSVESMLGAVAGAMLDLRDAGDDDIWELGMDPAELEQNPFTEDTFHHVCRYITDPFCESTTEGYISQNRLYLLFCYLHDPTILEHDAFMTLNMADGLMEDGTSEQARCKKLSAVCKELLEDQDKCPLKLESLEAWRFLCYLANLKKPDGTCLSESSYGNKRLALYHLYRFYGKAQPPEFVQTLKQGMRGLLREAAAEIQAGRGSTTHGKDPL